MGRSNRDWRTPRTARNVVTPEKEKTTPVSWDANNSRGDKTKLELKTGTKKKG